jgi:hypothetical protein
MPRRITDSLGQQWDVALTGRLTQYTSDEVSLSFRPVGDSSLEERFARFSPRGAKSAERAYEEATEAFLSRLLASSQPGWTAPDGGYAAGA